MFTVKVLFVICAVWFNYSNVLCWANYRFNLLSASVDYVDNEYSVVHKFEIKKLNRTFGLLYTNFTTLKVMDNFTASVQMYRYENNRYKEWMPQFVVGMCEMFQSGGSYDGTGITKQFIEIIKEPIRNILYGPGQKFPDKCPIQKDTYHLSAHVNEDIFPGFLFPAGRMRVTATIFVNKKHAITRGSVNYEIVQYVSETQKKRG